MTYSEAAKIVLDKSEVPMRVDEIWNKAIELGLDKEIEKTLSTLSSSLTRSYIRFSFSGVIAEFLTITEILSIPEGAC